jgi:hypothetical protein
MARRYNPPPNWPAPPAGWSPPAGWRPDPSWPSPPPGWQLWVEERERNWLRIGKRIYLGPAHSPLGRKAVRAGLLGLVTLSILVAPFNGTNPSPVGTDRVAMQGSTSPGGGTNPAQPLAQPAHPTATASQEAASIAMPNLVGQDGASARDLLRKLGVRGVGVVAANGKSVIMASLWTVVSQSHASGTPITADTAITLTLDKIQTSKPAQAETAQPQQSQQADPTKPAPPTAPVKPVEPTRPERTESPTPPRPKPSSDKPTPPPPPPSSSTDPRYGTCAEANANNYGPYQRGADPEYDWYQDRDDDGKVCEPR